MGTQTKNPALYVPMYDWVGEVWSEHKASPFQKGNIAIRTGLEVIGVHRSGTISNFPNRTGLKELTEVRTMEEDSLWNPGNLKKLPAVFKRLEITHTNFYTHLKDDIQGFQNPVPDFSESAWVSRKVGFSEEWEPIFGRNPAKRPTWKTGFLLITFTKLKNMKKFAYFF